MNAIGEGDWENAVTMFCCGCSIRMVSKGLGISRETAHRIQKSVKLAALSQGEPVRVNTGRNAKGELTYYEIPFALPTWHKKPHSGTCLCRKPLDERPASSPTLRTSDRRQSGRDQLRRRKRFWSTGLALFAYGAGFFFHSTVGCWFPGRAHNPSDRGFNSLLCSHFTGLWCNAAQAGACWLGVSIQSHGSNHFCSLTGRRLS